MRPWLRRSLYVLAALVLLLLGTAVWLLHSFDGERVKRVASDWMLAQHQRTLVFDGPLSLQLWPQPAMTVQVVTLSEPDQPARAFARIDKAALTLRLAPLLARREIEVEHISAQGLRLSFVRDAEGRRNLDDLLARAGGGTGRQAAPLRLESLQLDDAQLQVNDALTGVQGRLSVQQLQLGRFGPGLRTPMHLQAQAELTQPALQATLLLDAGLQFVATPQAAALPAVRLDTLALQLRGQGFDLQALEARFTADSLQWLDGPAAGFDNSQLWVAVAALQFSGRRGGVIIDSGKLALARLQLDVARRSLALEQLVLQLQGKRQATTFDTQLQGPALQVVGDRLSGGPVEGRVLLGGDQRLQLALRSKAPSGNFERISLPALHLDIDGQIGQSAAQGQADTTLALALRPLSATLEPLSLAMRLSDPALPPLQLDLQGSARLSAQAGGARVAGSINDQRVEARIDAKLDGVRPSFDIDASFGTLDLQRFMAPAQRSAAQAPTAAATPVDLQALHWADASLQLRVARLLRPPYRIDDLEVQAGIARGTLDLRRLVGSAWGGRFDASGSADAGTGRLALRLRANDVDLRALFTDTIGHDGLRGRGRIDAELRSGGRTVGAVREALNGRASLSLRPAAIRGIDLAQTLSGWRTAPKDSSSALASDASRQTEFSQLDASFEIRDGVARSTDLDGQSEFLRLAGEGTIDLARGSLDYALRARVVNTAGGRAGPEMVLLNGVTVPVALQGPFGNVQWQVNWPSVSAAVALRSVPNVTRGAVGVAGGVAGGVVRGAGSVVRGAAGLLRGDAGEAQTAPR